jgi:hypothetical protein
MIILVTNFYCYFYNLQEMLKNHHEKIKKRELKRKEVVLWGLLVKSNWACAETKKSIFDFFSFYFLIYLNLSFLVNWLKKKICGSYYRRMCVLWNCQLIFELNVQESLYKLFEGKVFFYFIVNIEAEGQVKGFLLGRRNDVQLQTHFQSKTWILYIWESWYVLV